MPTTLYLRAGFDVRSEEYLDLVATEPGAHLDEIHRILETPRVNSYTFVMSDNTCYRFYWKPQDSAGLVKNVVYSDKVAGPIRAMVGSSCRDLPEVLYGPVLIVLGRVYSGEQLYIRNIVDSRSTSVETRRARLIEECAFKAVRSHSMAGLREVVAENADTPARDTVSDLVADLEEAALVIADEVSSARISALAENIGRHNSVGTHSRIHTSLMSLPIDVWSSDLVEAALAENISSGQRFPEWSFIQTELAERPGRRLADMIGRVSPTITTPSSAPPSIGGPAPHLAKLAVQASITNKDTCPVSLSAIEEEEYALVPLCGHVCGPMAASLTACPTCRTKTGWTRVEKQIAPATGGGSATAPKPTEATPPLTITVYVTEVPSPKKVTIKLPVTATIADLEKEYLKAGNIPAVFSSSMQYHTASSPMSYIPKSKTLEAAGIQAWSTVYCVMNLRGD